MLKKDATEAEAIELALKDEKVQKYLEGKTQKKKVVYVPSRILNIVV